MAVDAPYREPVARRPPCPLTPFLAAAAAIGRRHRRRRGVGRGAAAGWARRWSRAALAARVPRPRAGLRRHGRRRPVPRPARRRRPATRDVRRTAVGALRHAVERAPALSRADATGSTRARSASPGRPPAPRAARRASSERAPRAGERRAARPGDRPLPRPRRRRRGRDRGSARAREPLDEPALSRAATSPARRCSRRRRHAPRLVVGDPGTATRTTSAGSPTARPASAGRCSSSTPRPARRGSAPAPAARSPTSGHGWTPARARGRTCASAGSAAAGRTRGSTATGTWCHGEAGIALTRLRAVALLGAGPASSRRRDRARDDARHLAAALPYAIEDLSLCHGAGGAADVLLVRRSRARRTLGAGGRAGGRPRADRAGAPRRPEDDWPCGVAGHDARALPRASGIGVAVPAAHDRAIPSPLAPWRSVDSGPRRT